MKIVSVSSNENRQQSCCGFDLLFYLFCCFIFHALVSSSNSSHPSVRVEIIACGALYIQLFESNTHSGCTKVILYIETLRVAKQVIVSL